jgi:hypothetical protein
MQWRTAKPRSNAIPKPIRATVEGIMNDGKLVVTQIH